MSCWKRDGERGRAVIGHARSGKGAGCALRRCFAPIALCPCALGAGPLVSLFVGQRGCRHAKTAMFKPKCAFHQFAGSRETGVQPCVTAGRKRGVDFDGAIRDRRLTRPFGLLPRFPDD